jgi:hypothetical protein
VDSCVANRARTLKSGGAPPVSKTDRQWISTTLKTKERRRHVRARIAATVTAWSGTVCRGSYVVENLSGGGLYVSGGPRVREGEQLRLVLQLPRGPVAVPATVVRCVAQARDYALAFRFESVSAHAEHAIARTVTEAGSRAARDAALHDDPTVLVVHEALVTREALLRELRALGREAACFATALDAIDYLDRCGPQLEAAIVDVSEICGGAELLRLLADDWPAIKRVPMEKPWDRSELVRALDAVAG